MGRRTHGAPAPPLILQRLRRGAGRHSPDVHLPAPVSPISCPDNVTFDSEGNLWVSTDGQPSAIKVSDGLYKVPVEVRERGHVQQFLAVPSGAETCGPAVHDRDGSVFVAVQHPGEEGSWAAPQSRFPDFVPAGAVAGAGQFAGPRPTVVQVTRSR